MTFATDEDIAGLPKLTPFKMAWAYRFNMHFPETFQELTKTLEEVEDVISVLEEEYQGAEDIKHAIWLAKRDIAQEQALREILYEL